MKELETNPSAEPAEHLFVTRLWRETSADSNGQWRGSVTHVNSDKKLYFANLGDLMAFIMLRLDISKRRQ